MWFRNQEHKIELWRSTPNYVDLALRRCGSTYWCHRLSNQCDSGCGAFPTDLIEGSCLASLWSTTFPQSFSWSVRVLHRSQRIFSYSSITNENSISLHEQSEVVLTKRFKPFLNSRLNAAHSLVSPRRYEQSYGFADQRKESINVTLWFGSTWRYASIS